MERCAPRQPRITLICCWTRTFFSIKPQLQYSLAQRIIFSLDQRATPFCILLALGGFNLPPGHRANYNVDPCLYSTFHNLFGSHLPAYMHAGRMLLGCKSVVCLSVTLVFAMSLQYTIFHLCTIFDLSQLFYSLAWDRRWIIIIICR